MIPSLMPKGVEHCSHLLPLSESHSVIPSLMPKGVEHVSQLLVIVNTCHQVIPSLMPKGVEHHTDRTLLHRCR